MTALGYIGAALLPIAWMLETYRTYEAKDLDAIDPKFVLLYVIGSFLLTVHAYTIQDLPFLILNLTMTMFTGTELVLLLVVKQESGEA